MSNTGYKAEIEQLKQNIFSVEWEVIKSAANRLGEIGGDEVVDFLISLLALDNSGIRDRAALALADIGDNRAVEPLLAAIFRKANHNYNGTMVYALESLDCSRKLKEIFKILFYETYVSKISAYAILNDQVFEFDEGDLHKIQQMWNNCNLHPETCPCIDNTEVREMMQDAADSFIAYLNPDGETASESK